MSKGGEKMKLTRDELHDIFARVSANEVHSFCETVEAPPVHEVAIILLVGRILDGVDKEFFK